MSDTNVTKRCECFMFKEHGHCVHVDPPPPRYVPLHERIRKGAERAVAQYEREGYREHKGPLTRDERNRLAQEYREMATRLEEP